MENTRTVSPFVSALFAAERIAKPGKLDGIHIAGSDAKVSTADLAPKILAYAFLTLRDEGAISLQVASKKVLFVTTSWVQVQRTGTPGANAGAVASLFNSTADGKSVRDAVYAWYRQDQTNPWPWSIQIATQEAIDAGYLAAAQQNIAGKIGSIFSGAMPTAIVAGKEADIRAIGDDAAKKWASYTSADGGLLELLVKQCASGISSRQQQSSAPNV